MGADHHQRNMSWDAYVSDQIIGSGYATAGAILSKEDGSCWATSGDAVVPDETATKLSTWAKSSDPSQPVASGISQITLNGESMMVLGGDVDDDIPTLMLKKGKNGAYVCVSEQCIIVGTHDEKAQPGQCRNAVFTLTKYLKDNSY